MLKRDNVRICVPRYMQIGKGTSAIASYVAITRVKRRAHLLIYRSFEQSLFTQGPLKGPELLLRVLRGDPVDWKKIEDLQWDIWDEKSSKFSWMTQYRLYTDPYCAKELPTDKETLL